MKITKVKTHGMTMEDSELSNLMGFLFYRQYHGLHTYGIEIIKESRDTWGRTRVTVPVKRRMDFEKEFNKVKDWTPEFLKVFTMIGD